MKIINMLKALSLRLYEALKRFPVSIGFSVITVVVLIILNHTSQNGTEETRKMLTRIAMAAALGIPLTLTTGLAFERGKIQNQLHRILIFAMEGLGLALFSHFLLDRLDTLQITRYIAWSLTLYLAFLVTPYLFNRKGFEEYVTKLFTRFFITAIYSVVLFLGVVAILFTIDKLLGFTVSSKAYLDVWLSIVGIFAVTSFLAGIPGRDENLAEIPTPKLLKVLLMYIVAPLLSAYTLILYIYFAKVIFTRTWPTGMVGNLVLWYSAISAIVIFFLSPLKKESRWVDRFIFLLTKLILPLMVLMFISMGIRIRAYGVTENRHHVIVLGLWAFGVMIYLNLRPSPKNIIMPLSLSIVSFLSVIGPWSSSSISIMSQNTRFNNLLERNGMLQSGVLAGKNPTTSKEDQQEINQILLYFDRTHDLTDLKALPKDFRIADVENLLGFPFVTNRTSEEGNRYFNYFSSMNSMITDIQGFDYLIRINGVNPNLKSRDGRININLDEGKEYLRVIFDGKEIGKVSMSNITRTLYDRYGNVQKNQLTSDELTFIEESDKVGLKIILQNLYGTINSSDNTLKINEVDAFVLVNLK